MDIPLEPVAAALGETSIPAEWRILLMRFRPARDGEPPESSVLPVIESNTALCPARYRRMTLADRDRSASTEMVSQPAPAEFETRVLSPAQRKESNLSEMLLQEIRGRVLKVLESEKHDRDQLRTQKDWERFRDPRIHALADAIGHFPSAPRSKRALSRDSRAKATGGRIWSTKAGRDCGSPPISTCPPIP